MTLLDAMYDRGQAPAGKPEKRDGRSTPCGRWRSGCKAQVEGIDPMRTCAACRAAGAPVRVPWEEAKPDGLGSSGEMVMEPLKNAGMSEMALHLEPKEEVGDFVGPAPAAPGKAQVPLRPQPAAPGPPPRPEPIGTFPCGHPRYSPHGFCGACNLPRL